MLKRLRNYLAVAILAITPGVTLLTPVMVHVAADTCTWAGTVDNNFSTAGNWTGCDNSNAAESGDNLVFPVTATNLIPNNDLTGATFASITFSGTGAMGYAISGNAFTLAGDLTDTSNKDNGLDNDITISGTRTITTPNMLTFGGDISGSGSLIKAGAGRAEFTGAFGLTGALTVNAGRLQISASSSADATFSDITVASGATFGYDAFNNSSVSTYTFSKPISSAGTLDFSTNDVSSSKVLNLTSAITLTGDTALIAQDGTTVHIQGALSGPGFKITAPGQGVVLNESTSNTTETPSGNLNPIAPTEAAPAAPDTGFASVSAHPGVTLAVTLAAATTILFVARKTSGARR